MSYDPSRRSRHISQAHQEWQKRIELWYTLFKVRKCLKGEKCIGGINCMDYHSKKDRRRFQLNHPHSEKACPNVWDYKNKTFDTAATCDKGDACEYSHNFYEAWYHQNSYKILECPYLKLTKMTDFYQKKECPFNRSQGWFYGINVLQHNPVKKIKGNIVTLKDQQHLCLDYCPFYHSSREQRFKTDKPVPYYNANKKNKPSLKPKEK